MPIEPQTAAAAVVEVPGDEEPRLVGAGRPRPRKAPGLIVRHSTAIELALTGLAMARRAAGIAIGDTDEEIDALLAGMPKGGRAVFSRPLVGEDATWTTLILAFSSLPDGATAADASEALEAMPASELWRALLVGLACHAISDDAVALAAACADGDRRARAGVLALRNPEDPRWGPARDELLGLSPSRAKALVQRAVAAVRGVAFGPAAEGATAAVLARSAAATATHAGRAAGGAPDAIAAVIERATGGVTVDVAAFDGAIVLAPGMAMRPWNVSAGPDDSVIVYRVPAEHLAHRDDEPPPALVRLTRALGDERRLRLLKLLAAGPAGLGPLSAAVGLAKSTVHHHLVLLRDAGLVSVRMGDDHEYELRPDALASLGSLLSTYLDVGRS